mgnify:CR=1 FL=1
MIDETNQQPITNNHKLFLKLSGLEPLILNENSNFINVGERTNVAGSRKFLRLIKEEKFDEALDIARHQVDGGAQIIDINFDDGLIDGKEAMVRFLNLIAAEPDICRVPIMIDSSKWEIIEAGLQVVQGKSVVNSISLKEGEELIVGKAITRYATANNEKTAHFDINIGWKKWAMVSSISSNDYGNLKMGSNGPDEYLRPFYVKQQNGVDVILTNEDQKIQNPSGYTQLNMMQKIRFKPNDKWNFEYGFHYSETSNYSRYDRHIRYKKGLPRYGEWYYGPQIWMMNNLSITNSNKNVVYDQMNIRLAHQYFEESRITRDFNKFDREMQNSKLVGLLKVLSKEELEQFIPTQATLLTPINNELDVNKTPHFSWEPSTDNDGDDGLIETLLQNLLDNAIKHGRKNQPVVVGFSEQGELSIAVLEG